MINHIQPLFSTVMIYHDHQPSSRNTNLLQHIIGITSQAVGHSFERFCLLAEQFDCLVPRYSQNPPMINLGFLTLVPNPATLLGIIIISTQTCTKLNKYRGPFIYNHPRADRISAVLSISKPFTIIYRINLPSFRPCTIINLWGMVLFHIYSRITVVNPASTCPCLAAQSRGVSPARLGVSLLALPRRCKSSVIITDD